MKRFCNHQHDTFIVGRYSTGACKKCAKTNASRWNKLNKEKYNVLHRKWYSLNIEKDREICRKWDLNNIEKVRECSRNWDKANPHKVNASATKCELRRKHRVPKFGQKGIKEFYENCPNDYEVDHIIPLQGKNVSGLHVIWNLQYLTREENNKKGNKFR
jgi:hypothetical protein